MVINMSVHRHVRNFTYLMLIFVKGVFYFCFYLMGITAGIGFSFTLVGLPILYYVMQSRFMFVRHERVLAKVYLDLTIDPVPENLPAQGGLWEKVRDDVTDARSWRVILGLMFMFVLGVISLFVGVLLYITPCLMVVLPVLGELFGFKVGTLGPSIYTILAGIGLVWVGPSLGGRMVKLVGAHIRRLSAILAGK
ncbi:sensor domain-containing protein [Paenibacillus sp. J22TS3]|uniref:sensor domain-containing protein n=1 Tax=Paenibacillus sp. J22TS3 TaxID=2807192 RepID=UPI001B074315|nr:sensor domain-containing protein [Paenibacillus sp. J22TS3]GIP23656.1 luciferase [Paenibacillus sp. J22TS3]